MYLLFKALARAGPHCSRSTDKSPGATGARDHWQHYPSSHISPHGRTGERPAVLTSAWREPRSRNGKGERRIRNRVTAVGKSTTAGKPGVTIHHWLQHSPRNMSSNPCPALSVFFFPGHMPILFGGWFEY